MLPKNKLLIGSISLLSTIVILSVFVIKCKPLSSGEYVALAKEKRSNLKGYKVQEVLEDYNKAIELDPNNIDAYNGRGDLYSRSSKSHEYPDNNFNSAIGGTRQDLAFDDFNKAIKIKPNAESYTRRAWSKHIDSALSSNNLGYKYDEGLNCYVMKEDIIKAIQIDPKYSEAYYLRGYCNRDYNKQEALEDYNKAIELDPNNAHVYFDRALLKSYSFDDNQGALSDYNQMIQINPSKAYWYEARGFFKNYRLEDKQGAISDYEQALKLYQEQGRIEKIDRIKSAIRGIESKL
jgi:tetratricopeptide (TPR) repeat protein